jgi:hypothetical protein
MSQGRTRLPLATDDWERVWGDQLIRAIDQNLDAAFANTAFTLAGGGTVTSVAVSGGTTGITTSGSPITTSGTITLGGTLAIANGGTGSTTAGTALTALGAAPLASPTFTGTVTIPAGASITGYATSGANSSITSLTGLTTPLSIPQGGTGASTLTANNVLLGNGTSAVQFVAPGASGNVLTSNGTTWSSTASAAQTTGTAGYALTGNGASPATFQGFLQPGTGATTRTWQNKAADFVSVKDFGAVGDNSADDTAAIQAALNTNKNVYMPAGNYRVTSGLVMKSDGQRLYGESGAGWLTVIEWAGANGTNTITISGLQHCVIESINIRRRGGSSAMTSGYGVLIQEDGIKDAYFCQIRTCKIIQTGNGVSFCGTGHQIVDCELRNFDINGHGIKYFGLSKARPSTRAVIFRVVIDNSDTIKGGATNFIHVLYQSYASSLIIEASAFLYGGTAIYMEDNIGAAYTQDNYSFPTWIHAFDLECDHQWNDAVRLYGGEGFFITSSWIGSTYTGNGIVTNVNWRGELLVTNSRIWGNAQFGILINAGISSCINNNVIAYNSSGSAGGYVGLYAGVGVGSNVSKFSITGNHITNDTSFILPGGGSSPLTPTQGYGIFIVGGTTDFYQIVGNVINNNITANILDGATSATNKIVQDYTVNGGGLKMTGNLISASIAPLADNIYQLGASGGRWTAVWAVNGTIQTSDPSLKTNISPLPSALPIIQDIDPVTFKWISGGLVPEKRITRKQLPILGTEDFTEEDVEETVYVDRPGKRTHWGFLASDVKAAFDKTGLDFGGYVKDEEGTEHLRPDQLIPVLWKAVQELKSEFDSYRKEHPETSPVATTEMKI